MTQGQFNGYSHEGHIPLSRGVRTCIVACFAVIGLNVNAQIIKNGDFEFPAIATGTYLIGAPTSWTGGAWISHPNSSGQLAGFSFTWPQAPDGNQYVDIGDIPQFAVSQPFTIAITGQYTLSWKDNTALNIISGYQTSPYIVEIFEPSGYLAFRSYFDSYHSNGAWESHTLTPQLAAQDYTLTFSSLNYYGGTNTLIDAVTVSAVPEPASAFFFVAGLLALSLLRGFINDRCMPDA